MERLNRFTLESTSCHWRTECLHDSCATCRRGTSIAGGLRARGSARAGGRAGKDPRDRVGNKITDLENRRPRLADGATSRLLRLVRRGLHPRSLPGRQRHAATEHVLPRATDAVLPHRSTGTSHWSRPRNGQRFGYRMPGCIRLDGRDSHRGRSGCRRRQRCELHHPGAVSDHVIPDVVPTVAGRLVCLFHVPSS
jgi:hypothetical protein